jgi:hypothetical protein
VQICVNLWTHLLLSVISVVKLRRSIFHSPCHGGALREGRSLARSR